MLSLLRRFPLLLPRRAGFVLPSAAATQCYSVTARLSLPCRNDEWYDPAAATQDELMKQTQSQLKKTENAVCRMGHMLFRVWNANKDKALSQLDEADRKEIEILITIYKAHRSEEVLVFEKQDVAALLAALDGVAALNTKLIKCPLLRANLAALQEAYNHVNIADLLDRNCTKISTYPQVTREAKTELRSVLTELKRLVDLLERTDTRSSVLLPQTISIADATCNPTPNRKEFI